MKASGRRGRPMRAYTPREGPPVPGLWRTNDGRWRVSLPDGRRIRFSEPDEARAVQKAIELLGREKPTIAVPLDLNTAKKGKDLLETAIDAARPRKVRLNLKRGHQVEAQADFDAASFWAAVRQELLTRPAYVAKMTGIPAVANLAHMEMPKPTLKLEAIIDTYQRLGPATDKSKAEAIKPLRRLMAHADAKTLLDLTTEKLQAFRDAIEADPHLASASTRRAYFARIKSVISFGLKAGLDSLQIRSTLDRCKVLWTAAPLPNVDPKPISREHLHKLLALAGRGTWRAWLLVGLNCCLHMEEVCALRWADIDLDAGTHRAIREKTRRKRIPRAAVLWAETIAELRALPRRGEYVFLSRHGSRYNKNTRVNQFAKLRIEAGLPDYVTFDTLRDGAYTAAIYGTSDERQAKVLAGQAAGLSDNYVLRNPEFSRPASEAVYRMYGPFPVPEATRATKLAE